MQKEKPVPMIMRCQDCSVDFTFTVGEQNFYAEKNFTPPKRCSKCRSERKIRREMDRD